MPPTKKKSSGSRSYGGSYKRSRSPNVESPAESPDSAFWKKLGDLPDLKKNKPSPSHPFLKKPRFNFIDKINIETIVRSQNPNLFHIDIEDVIEFISAIENNDREKIKKIKKKILKNERFSKETKNIISEAALKSLQENTENTENTEIMGGVGTPPYYDELPIIQELPSPRESKFQNNVPQLDLIKEQIEKNTKVREELTNAISSIPIEKLENPSLATKIDSIRDLLQKTRDQGSTIDFFKLKATVLRNEATGVGRPLQLEILKYLLLDPTNIYELNDFINYLKERDIKFRATEISKFISSFLHLSDANPFSQNQLKRLRSSPGSRSPGSRSPGSPLPGSRSPLPGSPLPGSPLPGSRSPLPGSRSPLPGSRSSPGLRSPRSPRSPLRGEEEYSAEKLFPNPTIENPLGVLLLEDIELRHQLEVISNEKVDKSTDKGLVSKLEAIKELLRVNRNGVYNREENRRNFFELKARVLRSGTKGIGKDLRERIKTNLLFNTKDTSESAEFKDYFEGIEKRKRTKRNGGVGTPPLNHQETSKRRSPK